MEDYKVSREAYKAEWRTTRLIEGLLEGVEDKREELRIIRKSRGLQG